MLKEGVMDFEKEAATYLEALCGERPPLPHEVAKAG